MRRLIPIVVSLTILAVIYWQIDMRRILGIMQGTDGRWMAVSLAIAAPLNLLTALRLQQLMPRQARVGFGEANRLILAASVLNIVLPSKMGDIAKAYFMKERGHLSGASSLSLVVFEKGCDMLSLLLWCIFGLVLYPEKSLLFWVMTGGVALGLAGGLLLLGSAGFARLIFTAARAVAPAALTARLQSLASAWDAMRKYFWIDKIRLLKITSLSVFIWFVHMLQIWLFILALRAQTPFLANLALAPLAILAGLLPLTFAGVGTRDAATIAFYRPFLNAPTAAALGLLTAARYLLPAIAGLLFLRHYLANILPLREDSQPVP